MPNLLLTGIIAAAFALVHIVGKDLRFLQRTPRSIWLSLAGGVSLAYVFVHLLPELAEWQKASARHIGANAFAVESHIYLAALLGLVVFYGLDRLVRQSKRKNRDVGQPGSSPRVFWIHLSSYAVYSVLIGYLLVHREEADLRGLVIYAIALGLHFVVNDQGLREYHGDAYDRTGRWLLAAAPPLGWLIGTGFALSPLLIALVFGFLAGGLVLNVLKEELPEDRESRFGALAAGAAGFALLLLIAR
ncbi:hypothetical protein E2493_14290 [Sphingomonas parva]|uniref:ZIP Zinc transporter n=1 Tax=Sphingomonas parva TaxID=2555898 RepID=A0A4Y8ZNF8_9SPHN|nr:hypothetical protein [Sphingomonas parva]TFI57538.1 hypothetical protein E2493_14290 [Sphingomonas parva]